MTRDEAITRLKNMAWLYGSSEREQNIEAIDMAIEALSEPSEQVTGKLKNPCDSLHNVIVIPCDAEVVSAEDVDIHKAHEEEHLNIVNRIKELQYAIEKTQTIVGKMVESAEAVQGEWVDIDDYYRMATCSHCHKVTMFEKWGEYIKPYTFCPNCGARMGVEE